MPRSSDPDVRLLAALADPARLAIVRQLASDGMVCACDFGCCADLSQPTVSHHLKVLREAGLVHKERRGTWIWYRLDPSVAARLGVLAGELAPGEPRTVATLRASDRPTGRRLPVLAAELPAGSAKGA